MRTVARFGAGFFDQTNRAAVGHVALGSPELSLIAVETSPLHQQSSWQKRPLG